MKKIAELWNVYGSEDEKKVQCKVCAHYCIISNGKRGFCRTRENIDGKLYTLVYGKAIHLGSNDPVEKKPLYHFWPGSTAYSIATIGCNFRCQMCQNWEISQCFPEDNGENAKPLEKDQDFARSFPLTSISIEQIIKFAQQFGARSIAYTYNEPTIWYEFVHDMAIAARNVDLKNILVTNGYSSSESNNEFIKFIDAVNIDFKAFNDDFYRRIVGIPSMKPVLETAQFFKNNNIHVEITNLLIPEENDNPNDIQKMSSWIKEHLGVDTPLHFSAYHPDYHLARPRTSSEILHQAFEIAQNVGLKYIYLGNLYSDIGSNTICPKCHTVLIEREGYYIQNKNLTALNKCKKCGNPISIIGSFP